MASLPIVLVCATFLILSSVSSAATGAFQEPLCSKYHFEENVLEKLVRIEHHVQLMDEKLQQFETRLEKGLGDVKLQQEALDSTKSSIIDKTEEVLSLVETNVNQTIEDVQRKVERMSTDINQTVENVQRKVERMSTDISDDRKNITDVFQKFMENTTAVMRQMKCDLVTTAIAFFARDVADISPSSGSRIRFTVPAVNVGDGYDPSTGYFTAPFDGTYLFTLQICTYIKKYINLQIMVAGAAIAGLRHYDADLSATCTSGDAIAVLKTGDQAWVKCQSRTSSGTVIYQSGTYYTNSFSGVLLHHNLP